VISGVCDVCVCACVHACMRACVHALKGKRLELSMPNLVHVYFVTVAQHALTQRSRSHGYETVTVAWLLWLSSYCCRRGTACHM